MFKIFLMSTLIILTSACSSLPNHEKSRPEPTSALYTPSSKDGHSYDLNGDQNVSLEEFMAQAGKAYSNHRKSGANNLKTKDCPERKLCQSLDKNKNGVLETDEFFQAQVDIFEQSDTDKNGSLSLEELKQNQSKILKIK